MKNAVIEQHRDSDSHWKTENLSLHDNFHTQNGSLVALT